LVGEHDPAVIFGGNCALIQHIIALGHCAIGTPSGGPHSAAGFSDVEFHGFHGFPEF